MNKLFFFFSLLLVSCDPSFVSEVHIINNTGDTIVSHLKIIHNQKDTIVIMNNNQDVTFFKSSQRGKAKNFDCCPCNIEELSVSDIDSMKFLNKDFNIKSNWDVDNSSKNRVICTFTVNENDID